ncbi:MAG: hypothetical protein IGR92_06140 [Leptolyngbyaceae cyanobacterium T60_A2020_046]|nr:hypothetical protein [Leptolyngbyaceae cyanobacterium T60_A2020_046]
MAAVAVNPVHRTTRSNRVHCPRDRSQGKPVKLLTLKSLLAPPALEQLNPQETYQFCESADCPVVYFSTVGDTFT